MTNPFFEAWTAPFGAPPLDRIAPEHFGPAYEQALADHNAEIAGIAGNKDAPSFANTILALEESGRLLARVEMVFFNLSSSHTNEALQAIEREMAPRIAAHWSAIYLNAALFGRIDAVHAARAGLDAEALKLLDRYHLDFVRAGARLAPEARTRLDAVIRRLAALGTQFSQNILADEQEFVLPLQEDQLGGLPAFARDAAAATARDRGLDAPYAVTLSRSSVEPFLQFADNRSLREQLFKAWTSRGDNDNANNNRAIIAETLALRVERAHLLGYPNFAAFKLADSMAGTPERARALLEKVWTPAKARALVERDALQALIAEEGGNFKLAPWDWRYYAEKLRARLYDFDEASLKPYLQLDHMIEAAFYTAKRLFDLDFTPRTDIPVYHPDVRVREVARAGKPIGLFYGDYFARPEKQDGAWMSALRDQENLHGPVLPLILNNCNFAKSDPALLSFDDARTLFHEFGHALHGLLSQVHYPRLSGTNVARDFVELPSQIYEHWLEEPEILSRFARHYQTGAPLPHDLLDKLLAARNFNQGFFTVELLGSAIVDMDFHALDKTDGTDPIALQARTLARIGMPEEIALRHAAPHFGHVFSGDGYSAGYYSYLWSEVLDADGFGAFRPDPFEPAAAKRLYENIYSSGGTREPAEAYRDFRGRDPEIKALLEGRGLV